MDPRCALHRLCRGGMPRARGDGPRFKGRKRLLGRDAPRERGWTQAKRLVTEQVAGCPGTHPWWWTPPVTGRRPRCRGTSCVVAKCVCGLDGAAAGVGSIRTGLGRSSTGCDKRPNPGTAGNHWRHLARGPESDHASSAQANLPSSDGSGPETFRPVSRQAAGVAVRGLGNGRAHQAHLVQLVDQIRKVA